MQGVDAKISSTGSFRSTCAISVCEKLLCKMSVSRSQQYAGRSRAKSLYADLLCMLRGGVSSSGSCMTTCARSRYADRLCLSLRQDHCVSILYDRLCKIFACGSLVRDFGREISLSGCLGPDFVDTNEFLVFVEKCLSTSSAPVLPMVKIFLPLFHAVWSAKGISFHFELRVVLLGSTTHRLNPKSNHLLPGNLYLTKQDPRNRCSARQHSI